MFDISSQLYNAYVLQSDSDRYLDHCAEVMSAREDLRRDMMISADFQHNALRNGQPQGMLFTRGGEQHTYNIVCMPGDVIYAGDMIEVFGSHWLVTEARADDTTHMTGIMTQCNHLFRFQNFDARIIERWGIVDMSGYSSAFNSDTQLQRGEEQMLFYLPYDGDTAKIFVDKRLASHIGYDKEGKQILFTFKVTGVNPVAESFNPGDHLLIVKAVRDLYSPDNDNLEFGICDYIAPSDDEAQTPDPALLSCQINGRDSMRIGTVRVYTATFFDADGNSVAGITPVWAIDSDMEGISGEETDDGGYAVDVSNLTGLVGSSFNVVLAAADGTYNVASKKVEVVGIG